LRTFMMLAAMLLFSGFSSANAEATEAAWVKLQNGGYAVLIRHAQATGTGDPDNFELGDCSTQRNLSARGQLQAKRIGARFAAKGVPIDQVVASEWCRTLDTAEFAFGRNFEIEPLPAINSFFQDRSTEEAQTKETIAFIEGLKFNSNTIMVTHQVNITALTGIVPRQGEAILVRTIKSEGNEPPTLKVEGRIIF